MRVRVLNQIKESLNSKLKHFPRLIDPDDYDVVIDNDKDIVFDDNRGTHYFMCTNSFRKNLKNRNIRILV